MIVECRIINHHPTLSAAKLRVMCARVYGRLDRRRWDGGDGRTKDGRTKDGRTKDGRTKDTGTKDVRTKDDRTANFG